MALQTETRLTRRAFLGATALTAGAAAGASLAGNPAIRKAAADTLDQQPEEQVFSNVCRGNCGGSCNLLVTVRDGKVVRVTPKELTGEAGVLQEGCVKGQANPQRIYGTQRLLYPMLQTGERGSDNWERITWDEAFELMAEKFQAAFDEYGPESVGFVTFYANLNYINGMKQDGVGFGRFRQKTGVTIMLGRSDMATEYMLLHPATIVAPVHTAQDLPNAKTLLIFGSNPAEAKLDVWPYIIEAKKKGAKLVCMDPRFSLTAARSDLWVPVRPGTDAAFFLGMANHIIDNDWIDYDYLRNHSVAPLLIKEDGTYLRLSDLGRNPIDVVAEDGTMTQLDCEVVFDEAAGDFGASREVTNPALFGTYDANGISVRPVWEYTLESIKPCSVKFAAEECGVPEEMIEEVAKAYATEGPSSFVHWCGAQRFNNSWRMYLCVALLAALTGNVGKPGAGYNVPFAAGSIYQNVINMNQSALTIDDPKPNTYISANRIPLITKDNTWNGREFNLRALVVMGHNPMESAPGFNELAEAYSKIDFVVVHDQFMTDTAKYASLALPCSMSFEDNDFNGTNRFYQKAIDPVGEGKSNFELFVGLADALGYDDLYDKDAEGYLREALDTPENIEAGLGYDDWAENGYFMGDLALPAISLPEANKLARTQFYLETLPVVDDIGEVIPLEDRLPCYREAYEAYPNNPMREKYPFFGMSYHEIYSGQAMHCHVPWLKELRGYEGEPYIVISENAAAERGIVTGDMVKTFNTHSYVVTRAVVSKGVRDDVIVVPRGYTADEFVEGNANALECYEAIDHVCSNDVNNDWLCQVEKI